VLGRAIVWQDRRTSARCEALRQQNFEASLQQKTGLLLDPYFSATKIEWLLDRFDAQRCRARAGELAVGTIDSFLVWRLSQGQSHITDASNASRTALFNLQTQQWDDELLRLFNIPSEVLPTVVDSAGALAVANLDGHQIPITAILGDQQASLVGQACFMPGMAKSTYGTGCFLMMNAGTQPPRSQNRLLATLAYRLAGQPTYALEGSIFMAGATLQWLRDGLGILQNTADSESMAAQVDKLQSVYLIPAFTGLGAPYWDADARGALMGLTRDTSRAEIVTAGLQSVCYQTLDLINAMRADGVQLTTALRVDGGMANNGWMVQFLADLLQVPVERPPSVETTVLGAAYFAALGCGLFSSVQQIASHWACAATFLPSLTASQVGKAYLGWQQAVGRITPARMPA
jgi:glycerol kinase